MDATLPADAAPAADIPAQQDAAPGQRFACGTTTCSVATEFCYVIEAGVRASVAGPAHPEAVDGGVSPGCNPIPPSCMPAPTCACITPLVQSCPIRTVSCREDHGAFTLICALP